MANSLSVDESASIFLEELAFRDYCNEFLQEEFQNNSDYWIMEILICEEIAEQDRIEMEENYEITWYENITA